MDELTGWERLQGFVNAPDSYHREHPTQFIVFCFIFTALLAYPAYYFFFIRPQERRDNAWRLDHVIEFLRNGDQPEVRRAHQLQELIAKKNRWEWWFQAGVYHALGTALPSYIILVDRTPGYVFFLMAAAAFITYVVGRKLIEKWVMREAPLVVAPPLTLNQRMRQQQEALDAKLKAAQVEAKKLLEEAEKAEFARRKSVWERLD